MEAKENSCWADANILKIYERSSSTVINFSNLKNIFKEVHKLIEHFIWRFLAVFLSYIARLKYYINL